ncbi:MAG TPA: polymer-forming cytoskeletal protein [bacterium]|nr:polymer-forming cytoskeletal protein [bacterium]
MFRRDNKGDSFEQQMGALRQQLGDSNVEEDEDLLEGEPLDAEDDYANRARTYGFGEQQAQSFSTPAQPPAAPSIPDVDPSTTVVSRDTTWKGEMSSEGSVHIHGRFDGAVKAVQAIFVAEGSEVDATLTAETIIVAGVSRGTVRARGKFEVLPSGRVAGDIHAPTLVVHEGAVMTGQLRMSGDEPTDAKPTPVIQRRANRGTA